MAGVVRAGFDPCGAEIAMAASLETAKVIPVQMRWVRQPQARQYLGGVSVRTFRRWEAKGIVQGFVVDKTKLYDLVALDRQVMKAARSKATATNNQ